MKADRQSNALHELLVAYLQATGFSYTLSRSRIADLKEIHRRGITSVDVAAVVAFIKRKIARGDNGYNDSSLTWLNAMNPDKMEDRVQLVRAAARKKAASRRQVPVVEVPDPALTGTELQDTDALRKKGAATLREWLINNGGRSASDVEQLPSANPQPKLP
jgi:hypothetical protein